MRGRRVCYSEVQGSGLRVIRGEVQGEVQGGGSGGEVQGSWGRFRAQGLRREVEGADRGLKGISIGTPTEHTSRGRPATA